MARNFYEDQIMAQLESYCAKTARCWLNDHNFTRTADIWEDAMQCARLGLLLYIRKNRITTAEDVFKGGATPYWSIYHELGNGIIMGACAPCGIHRPSNKTKVKFSPVVLDDIAQDMRFATASSEMIGVSELTVAECLADLRDEDRQIVALRLAGVKPGEIQRRLNIPDHVYRYRMDRIKKRLMEVSKQTL